MTKRKTRMAATNIGLVQCGATFFVSTFVLNLALVLRMKCSAKNPVLRQAANP